MTFFIVMIFVLMLICLWSGLEVYLDKRKNPH